MELKVRRVGVPSQYVEVEYIQSDGNQYINTDLTSFSSDWKYEFRVKRISTSTAFLSFENPQSGSNTIGWFANSTGYYAQFGKPDRITVIANNTDFYDFVFDKTGVRTNGILQTWSSTPDSFVINQNLKLFSESGGDSRKFAGQLAYFKITDDNDTLVRNFIPVKNKSNNEYGMFDLVTKQFYGNSGTGSFTGGAEVRTTNSIVIPDGEVAVIRQNNQKLWQRVPWEYEEVEYIESSGTQWIDTGIIADNNTEVELDYAIYSTGSVYIFGTRIGNPQYFTISGSQSGGTNTNFVNGTSVNVDVGNRIANAWNRLFQKVVTNNGTVTWNATNKDTQVSKNGTYRATIPALTTTIRLFSNSTNNEQHGRIYSCILKQNGVLVRNFIPIKDTVNNAYGMFDLVEGKFYGNAGTGAFTGGNIK